MLRFHGTALAIGCGLAFLAAGCADHAHDHKASVPAEKKKADEHKHDDHDDHAEAGPHGGPLIEWGNEEYHAELVIDAKASRVTVYLLDGTAKKAPTIDSGKITNVTLTLSDEKPPKTIALKFDASASDGKGIAFVGVDPILTTAPASRGSVAGTVAGKTFAGDFDRKEKHAEKHGSIDGVHKDHPGGVHVEFARGRFHAEAILHKGGGVHVFLLNADMSRVSEADAQPVSAYVREIGKSQFSALEFQPQPMPGDAKESTSRFVAKLPGELLDKNIEVTIPGLKIGAERYHLAFQTTEKPHDGDAHADSSMPAKSDSGEDEERQLYLKPGGIYSVADIAANGHAIGSVKFKDFKAAHDIKPKPGDKICPVTLTKSNPDCSWVINGQKYEFCCPPCVDEFVRTAKKTPEQIKAPAEYVKK